MGMIWTPREYHTIALTQGMALDRFNLHMSPGMGKTSTVLMLLIGKALMGEPFPALIVGPKRVANTVWTREVEKWATFQGLRVSKVIGTAAQREDALKAHADLYCINYENLVWLHLMLEHKPWPFKTTVADESTKIKAHRCSWQLSPKGTHFIRAAGSVNAAALMRNAWKSDYYMNLTGTPSPNGLKDLWGQQFPVDHGHALGQSFDSFNRRWFRTVHGSKREEMRIEPLPGAEDAILSRMRPTTISLNAYDWFDVERPREVNIEVELPAKARRQYDDMHRESVLKLSQETIIEAANGGALTNKCLQLASGHVYDEHGESHLIHTEKLQALESLVENLNGAPLLVAYWFKPELDAILKHFKFARTLPSDHRQKQVEDEWNAGRIPMLVVHPASAGHGLDLQHGGHNLCIYTPMWDLELYQQVIERIGPVRQAQAGYDRLVNVYRLCAENTWDSVVLARTAEKANTQDIVRDYLRSQGVDIAEPVDALPDISEFA